MCSEVPQYTLPKPTWPTTLELRGGYHDDPMFVDWAFLHPAVQFCASPKYSPGSINMGSQKNSGRVSELNSLQNSSNASRNNVNSDVSESDHSAPSFPETSSHDSSSSSLSETTVSQMQNSQIQSIRSSSEDSNNIVVHENITTVTIEAFSDNSTKVEGMEENQDVLENVKQTRSQSADALEIKSKEECNTILGIYDSYMNTTDGNTEQKSNADKDINAIPEEKLNTSDSEKLSRIALLKSKMSLPLVKVSDKNYIYLRPRSKTFSNLNKSGGIDGNVLIEKLNGIVKEENSPPSEKSSVKKRYLNGHVDEGWSKRREVLSVFSEEGDMETQV